MCGEEKMAHFVADNDGQEIRGTLRGTHRPRNTADYYGRNSRCGTVKLFLVKQKSFIPAKTKERQ